MPPSSAPAPKVEWLAWARDCCSLWGVSGLESTLDIRVSQRMRTSLGRCRAAAGEIRIASFLLEAPESLVREVVGHEVAHAAVAELHGSRVRPHGPEWKALMSAAGFEPRVRLPHTELERLPPRSRGARILWEHRCPVCQMQRLAGRPVRQWRCAACRDAGLEGALVISRTTAQQVQA